MAINLGGISISSGVPAFVPRSGTRSSLAGISDEDNLISVLKQLKGPPDEDGNPVLLLNESQIYQLASLKYTDFRTGQQHILLNPNNHELIQEITGEMGTYTFDEVYKRLTSNNFEDVNDIYNVLPGWDVPKQILRSEIEDLIIKSEISEGVFECKSCKSKDTIAFSMQNRSGDEPMVTKIKCRNCGKGYKF